MCIKIFLDKVDSMEIDNKILLFIFLIAGMFAGLAYMGALVVPNWQVYIDFPLIYQGVSYSVIGLMCFDVSLVIIITIKTAISNQTLFDRNLILEADKTKGDKKIEELEAELKRLQARE